MGLKEYEQLYRRTTQRLRDTQDEVKRAQAVSEAAAEVCNQARIMLLEAIPIGTSMEELLHLPWKSMCCYGDKTELTPGPGTTIQGAAYDAIHLRRILGSFEFVFNDSTLVVEADDTVETITQRFFRSRS